MNKKILIAAAINFAFNFALADEFSYNSQLNEQTFQAADYSESSDTSISGCSTGGGLRLSLATGDFWCSPAVLDPYPCGGYYIGFPDTAHNTPNNYIAPDKCSCFTESNIRAGGDYVRAINGEPSVFIVNEKITEPNCQVELHTVDVKDIKTSAVTTFSFYRAINKCTTTPAAGVTIPAPSSGNCGPDVFVAAIPVPCIAPKVLDPIKNVCMDPKSCQDMGLLGTNFDIITWNHMVLNNAPYTKLTGWIAGIVNTGDGDMEGMKCGNVVVPTTPACQNTCVKYDYANMTNGVVVYGEEHNGMPGYIKSCDGTNNWFWFLDGTPVIADCAPCLQYDCL